MFIIKLLYKINKLLINTLFCFSKNKRTKYRNKLFDKYVFQIMHKIESSNKNSYIFCPIHCIGDLVVFGSYIKAFKETNPGEVIFLVKDKNRANLIKQISGIDRVIVLEENVFFKIAYLDIPNNKIKKGKIYIVNSDIISAHSKNKFKDLPELYRLSLGLAENPKRELPIPTEKDLEAVEKIWQENGCTDKTIFISPFAESLNYKILDKEFWLNLAKQLTNAGCNVIFNAQKGEFGDYKSLFLSLSLIGPFCAKCQGVIGFRSGLCDIIATSGPKKLILLYPPLMDHPVLGIQQREVWKRTYEFDENLTDAQNMYKIFSLKGIIDIDNAQEIICDMDNKELTQICINSILKNKE